METPHPHENRILGLMLAACVVLLGLIIWQAGSEFPAFPRPELKLSAARSDAAVFP